MRVAKKAGYMPARKPVNPNKARKHNTRDEEYSTSVCSSLFVSSFMMGSNKIVNPIAMKDAIKVITKDSPKNCIIKFDFLTPSVMTN